MRTGRLFDRAGLEILDPGECLRLLRSVAVGRLVFTQGGLPAIQLIHFSIDRDTIVFASDDADRVRAAERGDVVAFEVDEIDLDRHFGWTVTSVGHLSVVPLEEAGRVTTLRPWPSLSERRLIRIGTESLTGRRLVP